MSITVDHGTGFTSRVLQDWAYRRRVKPGFIRPGKPNENGHMESFSGRLRDACLNVTQLLSMHRVPPDGTWWPAVGDPLERGVRPHSAPAGLGAARYPQWLWANAKIGDSEAREEVRRRHG